MARAARRHPDGPRRGRPGDAVLDLLGGGYGARVLLLVGPVTTAVTRCTPARCWPVAASRVEAVLLSPAAHAGGLAALRRPAGGRVVGSPTRRAPTCRRRHRRHRRSTRPARRTRSRCSPQLAGVPGGRGRRPVRGRRGRRPSSRGRTWSPTSPSPSAPTRSPTWCDPAARRLRCRPPGRHRPRAAGGRRRVAAAARRRRAAAGAAAGRPQVHPRRGRPAHRLSSYPGAGAAVRRRRRDAGWSGWCATPAPARCSTRSAPPTRRWSPPRVGCRRGSSARAAVTTPGRTWRLALADGVPVVVDADGLAHVPSPFSSPAVLTPHAGELARMLASSAPRSRPSSSRTPARPRRGTTPWCCSRAGTPCRGPGGRVAVTTTGVPWLAAAGAGDVLAGLVGSLVAAGLPPFDAASVGSWLHGAAATTPPAVASGPKADLARSPRSTSRAPIPAVVRTLTLTRRGRARNLASARRTVRLRPEPCVLAHPPCRHPVRSTPPAYPT